MINIATVIYLLTLHWVMDFVCQSDRMALNKSKDNKVLVAHCTIYAAPFVFFSIRYAMFLFATHFFIDFCTSRYNSYLWKNDRRHDFFVMIGFDQLLHFDALLVGYYVYVM